MAQAAGFKSWTELFANKNAPPENPERPTMAAWAPTSRASDPVFTLQAQSVLRRRRQGRQPAALYRRGALHLLRRRAGAEPAGHRRQLRHAGAPHQHDQLSGAEGAGEDRQVPRHHLADLRRRRRGDRHQPDLHGRSRDGQGDGEQGLPHRPVARHQPRPDQGERVPRPRRGAPGACRRRGIRIFPATSAPRNTPSSIATRPTSCSTASA